eukprot:COSAG05_NODE_1127_length_5780_cov_307.437775_5_plen_75_part_00
MDSQHDNLSRGSPRLMTSDRQFLYPQSLIAMDNPGETVAYHAHRTRRFTLAHPNIYNTIYIFKDSQILEDGLVV